MGQGAVVRPSTKRVPYSGIVFYLGVALLLSGLGYSMILSQAAFADSTRLSASACQVLSTALQPATIAAIAGATVTVLGAIGQFVKSFETRPHDATQVLADKVAVSPTLPPPALK